MAAITVDQPFQGRPRRRVTLGSNETTPWYFCAVDGTGNVAVRPTSGTMRVELTGSPESIVKADNDNGTSNAIALAWAGGDVSAATGMDFTYTTAVRFVSTGAGGVADISE